MNHSGKKDLDIQSDVAVIEQVQNGQRDNFAVLVQKYQPKLLGFFYRMTNSLEETEDLTQETFINIYFNLHKFDKTKDFYPWLFTIAHHLAVNNYHRKNRIRLIDIEKVPEFEDYDGDVLEQVVRQESKEMVRNKLNGLKLKYRTVLELRYLKEKSYQEISQALRLPINTVKSRLFRAKAILAGLFTTFV